MAEENESIKERMKVMYVVVEKKERKKSHKEVRRLLMSFV